MFKHIAVLRIKKINENRGSFLKIKALRGRPRLPLFATRQAEPLIYGGFADACQP
jgi:hypothetical protein